MTAQERGGASAPHRLKLARIADQLRQSIDSQSTIAFKKSSVAHIVPDSRDPRFKKPKIDLRELDAIIEIDERERTCTAESGVTFSDLVQATLTRGLAPQTVPELETLTLSGAVSGCSVESMSFRYGGFHDSCLEYEVIRSDGVSVSCSRERNSELFRMMHGSYGTLGILSLLKFKLIPVRPYVKLTYRRFDNVQDFWECLRKSCRDGYYDFVDGIMHGREQMVVCLGRMVDEAPYVSKLGPRTIYYKSTLEKSIDYLTTYEYYFRYDSECHWLTRSIPLMESVPFRVLFGRFILGSTNMIRHANRLRHLFKYRRRPDVIVDVFVPAFNFIEFYRWYESEFEFYPLWIVPYRFMEDYPWLSQEYRSRFAGERLFIDCAIYGKKNNDRRIDYSRILEEKVYSMSGVKTLISRNHYDEDTFWTIYNRDTYRKVKREMDDRNLFGELYEKMHPHPA